MAKLQQESKSISRKPASEWAADRVERRDVATLIPYARNARTHSQKQIEQIAASMREWGWTNPVLIDDDGGIIAGHGRVAAASLLGWNQIPVMIASGWSEAKKRAYVLADNQLALMAEWDLDVLSVELDELRDLGSDMSLMGFAPKVLNDLIGTPNTGPPPGEPESAYREQYGVIVICRDGAHQEQIYDELAGKGYEVKVVST